MPTRTDDLRIKAKSAAKEILAKYPKTFKNGGHLGVGFGWMSIIDDLCSEIEKSECVDNICIEQVKEKFGTLRFYVSNASNEIHELINKAENLSAKTCEDCGAPGEIKSGSWIRTLCDTCFKDITLKYNMNKALK